jgi:cytoskeletal protein CcmA (bactofilin family)
MSATVIGAGARVVGSIEVEGEGVSGDLVVEGRVEGSVRCAGRLSLGAKAEITGEITARDVRIAGRLDRPVIASGVIHLLASAEVHGDLEAARVVIDDGALFEGQVRLRRASPTLARAPSRPTAPPPARTPAAAVAPPPAPHREVPTLAAPGRRRLQRRGP